MFDTTGFSDHDKDLVEKAQLIKYWRYFEVYELMQQAESVECKKHLKTIASFLFDHYCNEI